MQLIVALMGTFFMTIVTGRMIPCITLVSGLPSDQDRGTFLVLLNSFRSLGSALATFVGGLIIVEENNQLLHFEKSGYISYETSNFMSFSMSKDCGEKLG